MSDDVPVRDAATVVIVRDDHAEGLEVLLVQRTHAAVFAGGAHVFPGGAAEPGDDDLRATAAREAYEESGLSLDPVAFRPLARWVTPPGNPRRFDTRFFVTAAPPGQLAACDGSETIECGWWRPTAALDAGLTLIQPTRVTLRWLSSHLTVDDVLAAAPYGRVA